ncbi:MAG: RNA 2'-phosphotransferase [Rhodospirillales bacterium]|nr:MAG: RNA 2'-phosphotransferase [Rhodospirillales bacterium]
MIDPADLTALSRAMSHALRHAPAAYGLTLAADGSAPLDDLVAALREAHSRWSALEEADLRAAIDASEKKRHAIEDGRIRARYGHSAAVDIARDPTPPPAILFHGTSPDAVASILDAGLRPMARRQVHLSADRDTALRVGRRKSAAPAILVVRALAAHGAGVAFFEVDDRIWLADAIPPGFITREA